MGRLASIGHRVATLDTRRGSSPATERIRGDALRKIRERIALRDECRCRICGRVTADGQVDHIVPLYQGGQESDENRQWLCEDCHRAKSEHEERGRAGVGQISGKADRS